MSPKTRQLVIGTAVGGLILFAVEGLSWAVFPWVEGSVHDLRDPQTIAAIEVSAQVLPGTYFINAAEDGAGVDPGPWGWMTVHPREAFSLGRSIIGGLVISLAVALIVAGLLLLTAGGYARRALVAGSVGLVALLAGPLHSWVWAWFSTPYAAAMIGSHVLGYGLMALALAKLVPGVERPGEAQPASHLP